MSNAKFFVGIDLGTTNSTMAYAKIASDDHSDNHEIEQFLIPQIIASGTEGESHTFPSFIYFPLAEELKKKSLGISWDLNSPIVVGAYAKQKGSEIPSRSIFSAKSWLCRPGMERDKELLPEGADQDVQKISPLDATAKILKHLKEAWNSKMDVPFNEQNILITVPASFDPLARERVLEASKQAGYPDVILLEEPQAAFYAWMHAHKNNWREILKVNDSVLVVDIGGGTTDFSLIEVGDEEGNLGLKRLAVGRHLLLGGDNIDLSMAYIAKERFEADGHDIDDWHFAALVHSCQKAKELLLSDAPPKHADITILGRGSKLIGGSLKQKMTKEEVHDIVVEGFAPLISPQNRSRVERRSGLQQLGLMYAQDARMTSQLAKFLSMTGEDDSDTMENFVMPTKVLFNGGTTKSHGLRTRLIDQLNQWAKTLNKPPVAVLPDVDYDFAVSRGAVNYGLARKGKAIRIKSGTSASYFIGVEEAVPAVPGVATPIKAICIAPFGMEEGSQLHLDTQEFALIVGEPTSFRFFSRATPKLECGTKVEMGSSVKRWKHELIELGSIEANLEKNDLDGKMIRVKIASCATEVGVLEVWCHADDGRKWKLEFNIRK